MVTHDQARQGDFVERYVRNELTESDRLGFEEHFFQCDECFADLQRAEEIAAGVRAMAARGALGPSRDVSSARFSAWTLLPAAAAFMLAVGAGWIALRERRDLENERARTAGLVEQQRLASAALDAERQQRAAAEHQVAALTAAEPNVPVAVLQSTRGPNAATTFAIPSGAARFVFWAPVEKDAAVDAYRLTVIAAGGRTVLTVDGLQRNADGAIVAGLPSASFQDGRYVVRIEALRKSGPALVGEYIVDIQRR